MAKLAISTSDRLYIDQHFGKTEVFSIYTLDKSGEYEFVEERNVTAACHGAGWERTHDENVFDRTAEILSDCDGVFVSHIGRGALVYLLNRSVRVFEVEGSIEAAFAEAIRLGLFWK
ncbi:MAG: dinitrogenase iron-molybdenum cofactor biosynthesis protein [Oscillospiraceae bacterium]|jgi:predicted Fe-Mo cluster-binding NifX family protein|nr:dinitrogenase iron-molybdenum cofactor biosynthesis protein [Oscillospiraceae bacterium]